ncbi:hypothetical protein MHO82_01430 [Vibrio sp. Of7-15]|uniref:hypothetical protein n=1 Tax=Vibrio sp. Of7-15 TaxID=2724879 RepID=UPI001EF176CD|nr:hypothetical protein [Vibrio sp. Of7-15]MCG7495522.1 hypothetical protein [Vibrio sp. Of7-15]
MKDYRYRILKSQLNKLTPEQLRLLHSDISQLQQQQKAEKLLSDEELDLLHELFNKPSFVA